MTASTGFLQPPPFAEALAEYRTAAAEQATAARLYTELVGTEHDMFVALCEALAAGAPAGELVAADTTYRRAKAAREAAARRLAAPVVVDDLDRAGGDLLAAAGEADRAGDVR